MTAVRYNYVGPAQRDDFLPRLENQPGVLPRFEFVSQARGETLGLV